MGRSLQWFFVAAPLAGQSIMGVPTTKFETKLPAEYPYGPQAPVLPVPKELPPLRFIPIPRSFLGLALIVAFVTGNCAVMPLMHVFDGPNWKAISVICLAAAMMFAQAGLLCGAFAFVQAPLLKRAAVCWGAGVVLLICWAEGLLLFLYLEHGWRIGLTEDDSHALQFVGLSLPLIALAIQSPLWFFRVYLGWRLVRTEAADSHERPLSIGDYLIGTAIAAVCITLAQIAPQPAWVDAEFWPRWAIVFASVAGVSLVSVIPAMVVMFRFRNWLLGLLLLVAYGLVAGIVTVSIFIAFDPGMRRGLSPSQIGVTIVVVFMFAAFAVFLGAGMKAMRDMGYSLALGRADGR
jgi:hypothetical protein